jgi:hypothetical protein
MPEPDQVPPVGEPVNEILLPFEQTVCGVPADATTLALTVIVLVSVAVHPLLVTE